jgi:DNA polymerase III delta prime subunit
MEQLDFNLILNRNNIYKEMQDVLKNFEKNKSDLTKKRGIYIYGAPGSGKTQFVISLLKDLNYDVIRYDAGDIRNKSIIDTITKHNMADKNIVSLFHKKSKPIAIVMDEIDGMNNGDKGGINSLIKLIRPKKTKKQKTEETTYNPIICISNYHIDKKIKELMKVCVSFELKSPNTMQISNILSETMTEIDSTLKNNIIIFLQGDLRKLESIYKIYKNHCSILKNEIIQNILKPKSYNEDTKEITKKLLNNNYSINEHLTIMNETDRTIVGLLWHENIIDMLNKMPKEKSVPLYQNILDNICYADYIDRITFQKQIWQFNEMSSLLKTFKNNYIFHENYNLKCNFNPSEVRFTKVLTKYSTEYNNSLFIQSLCQELGLDKKDVFSFFLELRNNHCDEDIYQMFESHDIGKLDINRIYRYIDKYTCVEDSIDDN